MFRKAFIFSFLISMSWLVQPSWAKQPVSNRSTLPKSYRVKYTIAQFIPFSYWQVKAPADPCISGNPTIGTSCTSGAIYAGIFDGGKYMVTPGGCSDSTTPTCPGTTDTIGKRFVGTGGTAGYDITGIENLPTGNEFFSSPSYRGDVNTLAAFSEGNTSANSYIQFCHNLDYAGYTDWYVPSLSELVYLYCKANTGAPGTGNPSIDPACTQLGGKQSLLQDFASSGYGSSTETTLDTWRMYGVGFSSGGVDDGHSKSSTKFYRCVRRYDEAGVDEAPDAIAWSNFNDYSTVETISGFDETIFLEVSSSSSSGTPNYFVRVNGVEWKHFDDSDPRLIAVRAADQIEFRIVGNVTDSGTITVKNATDDATTPTLDSMVATVTDPCVDNPAIGSTCGGGALYAGMFDGGKYMVTPGNCDNSATPTCDGSTDSLQLTWYGTTGSDSDIAGVETLTNADDFSSPSFRGYVNTAAMVASGDVSSDSAAHFCDNMDYGGYDDWYLPSKSELTHVLCKADTSNASGSYPQSSPNCTQFGGDNDLIPGFLAMTFVYGSSTETSNTAQRWGVFSVSLEASNGSKSGARPVRCVRRYDVDLVDEKPAAIDWSDIAGASGSASSSETLTGFDETIFLRLDVTVNSGSPSLDYNLNSAGWVTFTDGELVAVRSSDTLQFRITGTNGDDADVDVVNATDDTSLPELDTVNLAVSSPCEATSPGIGTTCNGGALFAGKFDGARYMVTPGACTDSATPTCSGGTDTVTKVWKGTTGTDTLISGMPDVGDNRSSGDRGDYNTATMVADASVSADSAADFCNDMTYGGHSDWFLPSKTELALLYCRATVSSHDVLKPEEDPNCVSFGGKTSVLAGFDSTVYWTSNQDSATNADDFNFTDGDQSDGAKGGANLVRCVRRYAGGDDFTPDAIDWADFIDLSSTETISGIDGPIVLKFDFVETAGSANVYYRKNGGAWKSISDTVSRYEVVGNGDTIQLDIDDPFSSYPQATITVTNHSTNTVIDTVVARNTVEVLLTTNGSPWVVPADWNDADNEIECIGAGGNGGEESTSGGGGGGGGAYASADDVNLTPSTAMIYQIGTGGGSTGASGTAHSWFGGSSLATSIAGARGGSSGVDEVGGNGGAATGSIGDTTFDGGDGGDANDDGGAGGGGAGGQFGAGVNGVTSNSTNGGAGGAGSAGVGGVGGAGGTGSDNNGEDGGTSTVTGPFSMGGGGGGGSDGDAEGGAGGGFGGGGGGDGDSGSGQSGRGADGACRINYVPL